MTTKHRRAPRPMLWRLIFQKGVITKAATNTANVPNTMPVREAGSSHLFCAIMPVTKEVMQDSNRGQKRSALEGISMSDTTLKRIQIPIQRRGISVVPRLIYSNTELLKSMGSLLQGEDEKYSMYNKRYIGTSSGCANIDSPRAVSHRKKLLSSGRLIAKLVINKEVKWFFSI